MNNQYLKYTILISFFMVALTSLTGWIIYQIMGETIVQKLYTGTMPWTFLNQVIKRQATNPISYYLAKVDMLSLRLLYLSIGSLLLLFLHYAHYKKWPNAILNRSLPSLIIASTSLHWLIYILEIPFIQILPYWFWPLSPKPLPLGWLILPILIGAYAVIRRLLCHPTKILQNVIIIVFFGTALQYGFAAMEGRGIQGIADRLIYSGHAKIVQTASQQTSVIELITHYEDKLFSGELSPNPHATKPPGLLAAFVGIGKATPLFNNNANTTHSFLVSFAVYFFPLLSAVGVIPLFFLARNYTTTQTAWIASILYITSPNLTLITLHADQYLHPTLTLTTLLLFYYSKQHWLVGIFTGVCLYISIFFSFALLTLVPMLFIIEWIPDQTSISWSKKARKFVPVYIGFLICSAIFYFGLDYNPLQRYLAASQAHQTWKLSNWNLGHTIYFSCLNILEFAIWCGIPVAISCGDDLIKTIRNWRKPYHLSGLLIATILILCLFGHTAAETGRLWIFLVPFVVISAAQSWSNLWQGQIPKGITILVTLQLLSTFIIKKYQDFY